MIYAIPGFLGLPQDWQAFDMKGTLQGVDLAAFSFDSIQKWVFDFNQSISTLRNKPSFLMGYSFGGRLALHALIDQPALWDGAIIISAHPGLKSSEEKKRRFKQDEEWAHAFLHKEWKELIKLWNNRKVFSEDSFQFIRKEVNYQRIHLANFLIKGSLGIQEDLREKIRKLPMPILWITGEEDLQYTQLAKEILFFNPQSKHVAIRQAGHRVPWCQPKLFTCEVEYFLKKLKT